VMSEKLQNGPEPAEFLLYQTEDGQTRLEVRLQEETVWLTQKRMAELFQKNVRTVNEHIQNIFDECELIPESVIRNFRITAEYEKYRALRLNRPSLVEKHFEEAVKRLPEPEAGSREGVKDVNRNNK